MTIFTIFHVLKEFCNISFLTSMYVVLFVLVNVCCDKTRILVNIHWIYTLHTRACFQECLVQSAYENTQTLYKVGQIQHTAEMGIKYLAKLLFGSKPKIKFVHLDFSNSIFQKSSADQGWFGRILLKFLQLL
jgi:hypothetical protein